MSAATTDKTASASSSRIVALDLMRGYFILVIASVHLHYYPSLLGVFDGRGQLWVSEAEGFFFISGTVLGLIRHRDMIRNGFSVAATKLWLRARKLYLAAMALGFLYLACGYAAQALSLHGAKAGLATGPLWRTIIDMLTLRYTYGWADFLVYYVAFILIAPAVMWLMAHRKTWVVLLATTLVWIWRWTGSHGTLDPFIQWQIYFFLGMVIGYHWSTLNDAFNRLSDGTRALLRWGSVVGTGIIIVAGNILVYIPEYLQSHSLPTGWFGGILSTINNAGGNYLYNRLLIDGRIGLLRPLAWLIVFAGIFGLVRRYEDQIVRAVGWLLVPFGSNSLYVYIVESLLLFAIPFFLGQGNFLVNTALEVFIVAVVWFAIHKRFLFKIIPR